MICGHALPRLLYFYVIYPANFNVVFACLVFLLGCICCLVVNSRHSTELNALVYFLSDVLFSSYEVL